MALIIICVLTSLGKCCKIVKYNYSNLPTLSYFSPLLLETAAMIRYLPAAFADIFCVLKLHQAKLHDHKQNLCMSRVFLVQKHEVVQNSNLICRYLRINFFAVWTGYIFKF